MSEDSLRRGEVELEECRVHACIYQVIIEKGDWKLLQRTYSLQLTSTAGRAKGKWPNPQMLFRVGYNVSVVAILK